MLRSCLIHWRQLEFKPKCINHGYFNSKVHREEKWYSWPWFAWYILVRVDLPIRPGPEADSPCSEFSSHLSVNLEICTQIINAASWGLKFLPKKWQTWAQFPHETKWDKSCISSGECPGHLTYRLAVEEWGGKEPRCFQWKLGSCWGRNMKIISQRSNGVKQKVSEILDFALHWFNCALYI